MSAASDRQQEGRSPRAGHAQLARKWAYLASATVYMPVPYPDLEQRLLDMIGRVFDAAATEPFSADPAYRVGVSLVELHCTGRASLQCAVNVLGKALLAERPDRVVPLLGALASGYADALRLSVQDQQERLNESLLAAARRTEEELGEVLARAPSGIAIVAADGRFLRTNAALGRMLGRTADALAQLSLFDLVQLREDIALRQAIQELAAGRVEPVQMWTVLVRSDGEVVLASLTTSALGDDRFVMIIQDETELSLLQRQMSRQLLHDPVTGLPNRQFLSSQLEKVLKHPGGVTLYHVDLDAFAMITGGLGWHVGDTLLRVVAERLAGLVVNEQAMVARIGPDEFAVVVENSPDTPAVAATVGRINELLDEPVYVDGHGVAASACIGVVHRPPHDIEPAELLRASGMTLRRARSNGRRQWELYDAHLDALDRKEFSLAAAMPGAWENGEITVTHRPVVRLPGHEAAGSHPVLSWGALSHDHCVRVAEETGLIHLIGNSLLRSACEQAQGLLVFVALTPYQSSDPDLVGIVLRTLEHTDVSPGRLLLGVPMGALGRDAVTDNLHVLADAGVGTAIHDFRGGPEGLLYLRNLPVRAVQIAQRLVDEASAIGPALTDLVAVVRQAGGQVIVGGIETAEQADWWGQAGADLAMGPYF